MGGQVVDTQSAEEFMRETLETVSRDELTVVAALLDTKAAGFAELLGTPGQAPPSTGPTSGVSCAASSPPAARPTPFSTVSARAIRGGRR